jgi:hypothetical protein
LKLVTLTPAGLIPEKIDRTVPSLPAASRLQHQQDAVLGFGGQTLLKSIELDLHLLELRDRRLLVPPELVVGVALVELERLRAERRPAIRLSAMACDGTQSITYGQCRHPLSQRTPLGQEGRGEHAEMRRRIVITRDAGHDGVGVPFHDLGKAGMARDSLLG